MRAAARSGSELMSLSHTRMTRQPSAFSSLRTRRSLATFVWTLRTQYALLCPPESFARRLASLRPCQKSPSAKTATFSRSNTTSGHPGSDATFRLNLSLSFLSARQSFTSHAVPLFRLDLAASWLALADAGRSPAKRTDDVLRERLGIVRTLAPKTERPLKTARSCACQGYSETRRDSA